jgi:hypothetical protein
MAQGDRDYDSRLVIWRRGLLWPRATVKVPAPHPLHTRPYNDFDHPTQCLPAWLAFSFVEFGGVFSDVAADCFQDVFVFDDVFVEAF